MVSLPLFCCPFLRILMQKLMYLDLRTSLIGLIYAIGLNKFRSINEFVPKQTFSTPNFRGYPKFLKKFTPLFNILRFTGQLILIL